MQKFLTIHKVKFNNLRQSIGQPQGRSIPLSDLPLATQQYLLFGSVTKTKPTPSSHSTPLPAKHYKNMKHPHR